MSTQPSSPHEIAIIGAGPTASMLLERIAANALSLLQGHSLRIHLIDPHRAGTGRVWRPDNHPLLWMNSLADDVTLFTDNSVACDGPIRPGPSLYEWAHTVDDDELATLAEPDLAREIRSLQGTSFPTRRVQSVYLDWFHRRVLSSLPDSVEVVVHRTRAIDLFDDDEAQVVVLDGDDAPLRVDLAVLALGHLDAEPDSTGVEFQSAARRHGLTYLPPGHTAELDLAALRAGQHVIALGFGQAFTDLLVLVSEGRGGRFVDRGDGSLHYLPSGDEPVIHVGSRRGVPYRSKLDYRLHAPRAPLPKFLDDITIDTLLASDAPLDFRRDVLPLVEREVGWAFYYELFHAHRERTGADWATFADLYERAATSNEIREVVDRFVPDPADRFDVVQLDRPLAGLQFESIDALHRHVRDHVASDVARRTDSTFSADLGAFNALLSSFGAIGRIAASGRLSPRSRVEDVGGWWFSFFMYFASGPPPTRLRQLLALEDAGLVRFIGADTRVRVDEEAGAFVASSSSHPDEVVASALIDARIATATVQRSADPLVRRLFERGEVVEEVVADGPEWQVNTGKVVVTGTALNLAQADGSSHPRRHALGSFTNRPAAGAFARPRTNAPAFRQNDTVARSILTALVTSPSERPIETARR